MRLHGLAYLTLACAGITTAASAQHIDVVATDTVVPGVVHRHLTGGAGPWSIHVLEVSLRQSGLSIRAAHAGGRLRGRESVRAIASRPLADGSHVVAAVNADFFDLKTGENENNQVVDAEAWKAQSQAPSSRRTPDPRSQLAFAAGERPLIERFAWHAVILVAGGPPVTLRGVNVRPGVGDDVLYTARYGAITPVDTGGRMEIRLRYVATRADTTTFQVASLPSAAGSSLLANGPVLSIPMGAAVPRAGTTLRIVARFTPARGAISTLVGGWPRLVVHGRSIADSADRLEGTTPAFSAVRHPRTGAGFSRDSSTLFQITVDGRQESSSGMSLSEFASLMIQLGVYEGLNLDGGGSTTMVIDGRVVNHPSVPGGERTVGNALLVVLRDD